MSEKYRHMWCPCTHLDVSRNPVKTCDNVYFSSTPLYISTNSSQKDQIWRLPMRDKKSWNLFRFRLFISNYINKCPGLWRFGVIPPYTNASTVIQNPYSLIPNLYFFLLIPIFYPKSLAIYSVHTTDIWGPFWNIKQKVWTCQDGKLLVSP